jgi:carbamoyltransferase
MITLGINIGETESGVVIYDGGAAIAKNGKLVAAIGEERVSRKKYAAGFDYAIPYLLHTLGVSIKDVECCAVSFCGQPVRTDLSYWTKRSYLSELKHRTRLIPVPSHHYSHALTAYHFSGFDEALIIIFDNEGNALDDCLSYPQDYLRNPFERSSYYLGKGGEIKLLHRDHDGVDEVSLGEAYRQFTHFVGFPSGLFSGKTMGLAGYGNPERFASLQLFELQKGRINTLLNAAKDSPGANVQRYFEEQGIDIGPQAQPCEIPGEREADVARFVQDQLESIVCRKIQALIDQTGIKQICLGGGVAYNVLMNSAVLERTSAEQVFVHPAAGDQGQGIGNALYAYQYLTGKPPVPQSAGAYLGPEPSQTEIKKAYRELEKVGGLSFVTGNGVIRETAQHIANGKFVGWFHGRSEMGPRALGHRSILADPRGKKTKDTLNARIKYRESFRPFAPSVTSRQWHDYFDGPQANPFMLFSARVRHDAPVAIPAVTHVDQSARPQSVDPEANPKFHALLEAFGALTGCEVLLNTSFNLDDEPIVETPMDAVRCFLRSNLDALMLEDILVVKS